MVPPRLTLVHSANEADNDKPAAEGADRGRSGAREAQRSPEAARDAAEALAELARSALAAADVVTGTGSKSRVADSEACDDSSAARADEKEPGAGAADEPPAYTVGVAGDANAAFSVADPEAAAATPEATGGPERAQALRILEALLFAAAEPLDEGRLAEGLGRVRGEASLTDLLSDLQRAYQSRGVNLVRVAGKWAFRTAEDLSWLLERHASEERRLSKAALETLSIIAYHQPVTRAEIEDIRGVSTSAGTLDILLETGWVRPRGRRRAPGRPVTYGTTDSFLNHFGLDTIKDLPGLAELKGAGLLDSTLPPGFAVPEPCDVAALMPDELPLDTPDDEDAQGEMELAETEPPDDLPPEA